MGVAKSGNSGTGSGSRGGGGRETPDMGAGEAREWVGDLENIYAEAQLGSRGQDETSELWRATEKLAEARRSGDEHDVWLADMEVDSARRNLEEFDRRDAAARETFRAELAGKFGLTATEGGSIDGVMRSIHGSRKLASPNREIVTAAREVVVRVRRNG